MYLYQTGESAVIQASSWWTYSGEKDGTAGRMGPSEAPWGIRGVRVGPGSHGDLLRWSGSVHQGGGKHYLTELADT